MDKNRAGTGVLSGSIAITTRQQADGSFVCDLAPTIDGRTRPADRAYGQNSQHAIAIALEKLARAFRLDAEKQQGIDWEATDRSSFGDVAKKRFHVIVHYERVGEEVSKFDALVNTQMGDTIVENAEVSIVRVDPSLPIVPIRRDHE